MALLLGRAAVDFNGVASLTWRVLVVIAREKFIVEAIGAISYSLDRAKAVLKQLSSQVGL